MDFQKKLSLYNAHLERIHRAMIKNDSLDEASLAGILASRNELLIRHSVSAGRRRLDTRLMADEYPNECEPLSTKTVVPQKFRAYHCGMKMQPMLVSQSTDFEGSRKLDEVYFSLNLRDVFRYLDLGNSSDNMIYVLDSKGVKDSWIQKDYSSEVLWGDKLRTLLNLYDQNRGSEIVSVNYDPASSEHRYTAHFAGTKLKVLKAEIIKEMDDWKIKHAVPFNPNRVERYKSKNLDYLLVKGPVKVKYPR